jgi:pimeloyl-ACP methyl ester carboxylesterase
MRPVRCGVILLALLAAAAIVDPALARDSISHAAVPPPVRFVHVDGATIAYRDFNPTTRGTPLLMIVGYGATMAEWDPTLVNGLAQGRRVIMLDNRGAGDSTGPLKHLSVRLMAEDAYGVIHALKLGRLDVMGWSMGGFIAQELTLDHPEIVRRLILAATNAGSQHAVPDKPTVERTLTNPATTVPELLPILFPDNQVAAGNAWIAAIASQPGVTAQAFAISAATKAAQKTAVRTLWDGPGEGSYARLSRLRAPTLVAYGTDDVIIPPVNSQILLKRIPHAKGARFRDAGHAFLFQDPVIAARAFTAFLGHTT